MEIIDWLLHVDKHLVTGAEWMGPWLYALLFAIVFCETGLVITPFLPGDSLLFAVGGLIAVSDGAFSLPLMMILLIVAAVVGDAVNYAVGKFVGPRVFRSEKSWLLNKSHLDRAQRFYERHGGKAIIFARFVPIVRTFAPFVAGIGRMSYHRFWMFNVVGAILWVSIFLVGGYWFANLDVVKRNFHIVIFLIIGISILPIVWEWYRHRSRSDQPQSASP
ncbi:MAG TPA: DedA family protein [Pirellulaceae bacterium]|nr:DedA family protein [Pirellulaceae bacterium]